MSNWINFFAYDELMDEKLFLERGLKFNARFCVTLSCWKLVFNKIPLDNGGVEKMGLPNIVPTSDNLGMMSGVLYEMDECFLPKLDEIHQHPQEYIRKAMQFIKHDFTRVKGLAYIAPPEKTRDDLTSTKAMIKRLRGVKKSVPMLYFSRLMNTHTAD